MAKRGLEASEFNGTNSVLMTGPSATGDFSLKFSGPGVVTEVVGPRNGFLYLGEMIERFASRAARGKLQQEPDESPIVREILRPLIAWYEAEDGDDDLLEDIVGKARDIVEAE